MTRVRKQRLSARASLGGFLVAMLLLSAATLHPSLGPFAWPGIAAVAFAIANTRRWTARVSGVSAVLLAYFFVTFRSLEKSIVVYGHLSESDARLSLAKLTVICTATSLVSWLPLLLVHRIPVSLALPVSWVAGERLLELVSNAPFWEILYTQWMFSPVLRALGRVGWYPTLFLWLLAGSATGEALARRSVRLAAAAGMLVATMLVLPALPQRGADVLRGIAAVQMADGEHPPPAVPEGLRLVVWPEAVRLGTVTMEEGLQRQGEVFSDLPDEQGQLINVQAVTRRGLLNATVAVGGARRATEMRGKSLLAPVGERRFLGVGESTFEPGHGVPMMRVGGLQVIPAICYEAFSRDVVAEGRAAGGELLAIMSNDLPVIHAPDLVSRSLGAAVLRGAEFGVPVVRAALWGENAFILPDGTIIASGPIHATSVLLLPLPAP